MGSDVNTPIAELIGQRIQQAMGYAGLTKSQFARALDRSERAVQDWLIGRSIPWSADIVRLAAILHADPRWLVTGEPSDAAVEAQAQLRFACETRFIRVQDEEHLSAIMGMLEQPMGRSGTCRYCGVKHDDQDHSPWADSESSICYLCLKPKR